MDAKRFAPLRRGLVRCAYWLAALVAFIYLCDYLIDARLRMTKVPDCKWNSVPNPENAPYSARYCYLNKEMILLRLYDIEEQHLLAERTFAYPTFPKIFWDRSELQYIDYHDLRSISLPPTLLDRLRTKLP